LKQNSEKVPMLKCLLESLNGYTLEQCV